MFELLFKCCLIQEWTISIAVVNIPNESKLFFLLFFGGSKYSIGQIWFDKVHNQNYKNFFKMIISKISTQIKGLKDLFFIMIYSQYLNMNMASYKSQLLLLALLAIMANTTIVTFYVDHEVQQPLDYVQISAIIKTNSQSLEESINDAAAIIKDIENSVKLYCLSYAKDKTECINITESSPYSIKPQYEIQNKKPIFAGFVVAHQILIKVKQSPLFGQLVDDIMKKGVDKIETLQWKPLEEVDGEEYVVEQGISQANEICKKIGMKLSKILSVQEVTDFGEEEQQDEDGDEEKDDENEDQQAIQKDEQKPLDIKDNIIYYKFAVECTKKGK